uniref:Uncharacterized protein n=1 Tax=Anguilla anguilla TaxID=7936 RepID=A0A0E9XU75_ANGAN
MVRESGAKIELSRYLYQSSYYEISPSR